MRQRRIGEFMVLITAVKTAEFVQCGVHRYDCKGKVPFGMAA